MDYHTIWILMAVYGTSLLSGMFGMAGGMVLMGVYTTLLPVAQAMVLHGFTQLAANVFRWFHHRGQTDWRGVGWFAAGSLLAAGVMVWISYIPDKATVLLVLGLSPFVSLLLPDWRVLTFSRPSGAFMCGLVVTGVQLLAGVAGPILDQFFVRSARSKEEQIATKSMLNIMSHALKLTYFLRLQAEGGIELSIVLMSAILISAWLGTQSGSWVLTRLSDRHFRQATRALVLVMGGVYLVQSLHLLAGR